MAQWAPIGHIITDFRDKFGIPRQSNLADAITGKIVFAPPYRVAEAFRELESYSHIWLIWEFSANAQTAWSPTVRPPRLGGNKRIGVFATRSPFRPNPIGLSVVKLIKVEFTPKDGPVLWVSGVDLMSGTPIYDIKPYLPYVECIPEATGGFSENVKDYALQVHCPESLLTPLSPGEREGLLQILSQDPRPAYQKDPDRRYGMSFAGFEVSFSVDGAVLTVHDIIPDAPTQSKERP